jgi:hypothetical protein
MVGRDRRARRIFFVGRRGAPGGRALPVESEPGPPDVSKKLRRTIAIP